MPEVWNQHTGPNPEITAFLEKAINYTGDDCLIWPFGFGAGRPYLERLKRQYGTQYVSKAICIEVYGPPPTPEHEAAHSCGNGQNWRGCINPKHLRWATHKENMADDSRGEDCSWTKLTAEQVLEIRRLAGCMTHSAIAEKYGMSKTSVTNIINRHSWRWLEEPCDAELLFDTTRPRMKDLFAA